MNLSSLNVTRRGFGTGAITTLAAIGTTAILPACQSGSQGAQTLPQIKVNSFGTLSAYYPAKAWEQSNIAHGLLSRDPLGSGQNALVTDNGTLALTDTGYASASIALSSTVYAVATSRGILIANTAAKRVTTLETYSENSVAQSLAVAGGYLMVTRAPVTTQAGVGYLDLYSASNGNVSAKDKKSIKVGVNPTSLAVLNNGTVAVLNAGNFSSRQASVSIVDPKNQSVVKTYDLPQGLVGQFSNTPLAVDSDNHFAYIGTTVDKNETGGQIVRLDLKTGQTKTLTLADATGAHTGVALKDGVLYVTDFNTGRLAAVLPEAFDSQEDQSLLSTDSTPDLVAVYDLENSPGSISADDAGLTIPLADGSVVRVTSK